jgi:hypothetical protein
LSLSRATRRRGGLENARTLEDFVPGLLGKLGRVFYRFAPPGEL